MKQPWYISHAETITQNVVGLFVAFIILHIYGLPLIESIKLQTIFFVTSYIRSYLIRRLFNKF